MTDEKPTLPGIFLDSVYSKALMLAALNSGRATVSDEFAMLRAIRPKVVSNILDKHITKKFQTKALEMALLFDYVHLFGLPDTFDMDSTRAKLNDLVGLSFMTGQQVGDVSPLSYDLVRYLEPHLKKSILRKLNLSMRSIGKPEFSMRTVSAAYNAISEAIRFEVDTLLLRNTMDRLFENTQMLKEADFPYRDAILEMLRRVIAVEKPKIRPFQIYFICFLVIFGELVDTIEPTVMSTAFGTPLLTSKSKLWADQEITAENIGDTFRLYRFAMEDMVGYAPWVETMDDVLRLREHKGIVRLRECIKEWAAALHRQDGTALERIRKDIRKATCELKSLEKCRKIDRWLFWIQIPSSFVPVLSQIATFLGTGTRWLVESKEEKHSWVLIGR